MDAKLEQTEPLLGIKSLLRKESLSGADEFDLWKDWEAGMRKFAHNRLMRMPHVRHGRAVNTTDILQETFIRLLQMWSDLKRDGNRNGFLALSRMILKQNLTDHHRAMQYKNRMDGIGHPLGEADAVSKEDHTSAQERIDWVVEQLAVLEQEDADLAVVVNARLCFNRSFREIAAQTGFTRYQVEQLTKQGIDWLFQKAKSDGIA